MRLFDAHNHLQDPRLDDVRDAWLASAGSAGWRAMVVNGTRPADWPRVLELARRDPLVLPSFGLHPWHVEGAPSDWFDTLLRHLDQAPRAIGEIGLDRWIPNPDLPRQEDAFLRQLHLAAERNLPVSVHGLRHWERLEELMRIGPRPARGFLLHSYGGPADRVAAWVSLGAYFSISGSFFLPGRERKRDVFLRIPPDRLLIETDAPDMAGPPSCQRLPLGPDADGKARNHPGNLAAIYAATAAFLGREPDRLAAGVERNFLALFGPAPVSAPR